MLFYYLVGDNYIILPSIIGVGSLSILIFYLLCKVNCNRYIVFIIPILSIFLPPINSSLYDSMWDSFPATYYMFISLILLFLYIYSFDNKRLFLCLISTLLMMVYRNDKIAILFIIIFLFLITSKIFVINKRITFIYISIVFFIVTILIFKFVSPKGDENRYNALYKLSLYSYMLPQFYQEDTFIYEEKEKLKLFEIVDTSEYKKLKSYGYKITLGTNMRRLDFIQKNYLPSDTHSTVYMMSDIDPNYIKSIVLKKIIKNPIPAIYSRVYALLDYIFVFSYPTRLFVCWEVHI